MKIKILACLSLIALIALLSPASHAQTFSSIHAFSSPSGVTPQAGVSLRAGVLYVTTYETQDFYDYGKGTVYQLSHAGSNWHYTPISLFSAGGFRPEARVVFGPDNLLYGTTLSGGSQGDGIVFNLTPLISICKTANCFWTEKVLYQFQGSPDGDDLCCSDLVWDSIGNIYGTTYRGGSCNPPYGCGTVFEMTKFGDNWTEMPIYSFGGPDGENPAGGVILDGSGDLFGTTQRGGSYNAGTVFKLTYTSGVGWTETVLYNFQNLSDGQEPTGGLLMDSAGNLYGTTLDGGSGLGGTVFELSPVGDTWVFTTLYSISGSPECGPVAALTMDSSGNLYGTTVCDGGDRAGNVFKLTNTQNGWEYTSLHDFTGGTDGAIPYSNVTIDTDGTLYGTAEGGGNSSCFPPAGCGTVWMIKP